MDIKIINENTGFITEREIEVGSERFLVCVSKFGQTWSYLVLNIDGQTIDTEQFQDVINEIMRTWRL